MIGSAHRISILQATRMSCRLEAAVCSIHGRCQHCRHRIASFARDRLWEVKPILTVVSWDGRTAHVSEVDVQLGGHGRGPVLSRPADPPGAGLNSRHGYRPIGAHRHDSLAFCSWSVFVFLMRLFAEANNPGSRKDHCSSCGQMGLGLRRELLRRSNAICSVYPSLQGYRDRSVEKPKTVPYLLQRVHDNHLRPDFGTQK